MSARGQPTLFELTQDGLVIDQKLQRVYPEFDTSAFVVDVRTPLTIPQTVPRPKGVSWLAPF